MIIAEKILIQGRVQGVGFRPFVYKTALEYTICGEVSNTPEGVLVLVEGTPDNLKQFKACLKQAPGDIHHFDAITCEPCGFETFSIVSSSSEGIRSLQMPVDLKTCDACLAELNDPANRRYRYPFINCTHCGPRYSIIRDLPYDRPLTSMARFKMCPECQREYEDPLNRRFHAQPNACPDCGPSLSLLDADGNILAHREKALAQTIESLKAGKIIAVKGLGGFHIMVDPSNETAVRNLRKAKHRPTKPFALMALNLEWVKRHTLINSEEEVLLTSKEAPIVLLKRKPAKPEHRTSNIEHLTSNTGNLDAFSKRSALPNNRTNYLDCVSSNSKLGIMLPYTPLHWMILNDFRGPLIATSGNRGEESICIGNKEALETLGNLVDYFLVHDRPIVRALEDSIVKVVADRPLFIRRARGFAPSYLKGRDGAQLALGGDLKNTVAINLAGQSLIGPYQGDVAAVKNFNRYLEEAHSLLKIEQCRPEKVVCDAHPGYRTHQSAETFGETTTHVQHHLAHLCSVVGEHQLEGPVLGMIFDGTGYGLDGSVWGGEWIHLKNVEHRTSNIERRIPKSGKAERVGHLRPFCLEGGEAAIKHPERIADALLHPEKGGRGPLCSSMGRLFDGVSALIGFTGSVSFEGEAAIQLEEWATADTAESYPFTEENGLIDWAPMIKEIIRDKGNDVSKEIMATKFHNTVIEMMVLMAKKVDCKQIVLNGGCFQNDFLLNNSVEKLSQQGFKVYWPKLLPANDGGLSYGQLWASDIKFD